MKRHLFKRLFLVMSATLIASSGCLWYTFTDPHLDCGVLYIGQLLLSSFEFIPISIVTNSILLFKKTVQLKYK